ncbi:MAG: helix-turn-helix transcriptional regulator [Oscillospiraceae bacterium]|nr:helix-turn-helix transcriptional regulator [Oscillospiraceae bacterium]
MPEPKDRIRERREALGLSQLELALKLGYTDRSTIAKLEAGVNNLNAKKLVRFAEALQTTVPYLMGLEDDYYDYDKDPDDRRLEIPETVYNALYVVHKGDFHQIWLAYLRGEGRPKSSEDLDEALKFALFGGGMEITDEMFEEVKQFARFVRSREQGRKDHS